MYKMAAIEKLEIRTLVKLWQQMGDTPTASYKKIRMTKGEKSCSSTHVFEWRKRFRDGEERLADKDGRVRKRKNDAALVTSFAETLKTDKR